jgi:hypothetical protein
MWFQGAVARAVLADTLVHANAPAQEIAQRLQHVFEIDVTLCSLCGGQLRVIADVTDPELIGKILDHVQQRAPPKLPPRGAQSDTTYPDLFAKRQ